MDVLIKAIQFLLSLAILVTLHEFGHFLPAVWFKTRIEKFYLFFNPGFSLFRFKKVNGVKKYSWFSKKSPDSWSEDPNTTEWGLGWLPLGGYVKIAGMIDESMDTEQMKQPAQAHEFRSKKAWQRLIIMVGGVVVNLFLGFFIYSMVLFAWGSVEIDTKKIHNGYSVHPYLNQYGLQSGDFIYKAEGETVQSLEDLNKGVLLRGIRTLDVKRAGKSLKVVLPKDIDQRVFQNGAMGLFSLRAKTGKVTEVVKSSGAEKAGIKPGDAILSINLNNMTFFDEVQGELYRNKGKSVAISVERAGDTIAMKALVSKEGLLGFASKNVFEDSAAIYEKSYSFGQSFFKGTSFGLTLLSDYVSQFKFVFTKKGAKSLGGFATIGNMFPAQWDWKVFWLNTAFLSIILAFMNILPIPALDGGFVVFLLYEIITGKEAPQKVLEYAQYVGIFLLLSLMIYANANDLIRIFSS